MIIVTSVRQSLNHEVRGLVIVPHSSGKQLPKRDCFAPLAIREVLTNSRTGILPVIRIGILKLAERDSNPR